MPYIFLPYTVFDNDDLCIIITICLRSQLEHLEEFSFATFKFVSTILLYISEPGYQLPVSKLSVCLRSAVNV